MKICSKCKVEKELSNFYAQKRGKFGITSICKECMKEKGNLYREENKDIITKKRKIYLINNRDKQRKANKKSYLKHREMRLDRYKDYQKLNRSKRNAWYNNRRKVDPLFKLKTNIKRSIQKALKYTGNIKKDLSINILGCSISHFKAYIESKFDTWMSWDNHGVYIKGEKEVGWDLDHIIPLSSAKTEKEALELCYYTNYQPLCSYKNRYEKKDKL